MLAERTPALVMSCTFSATAVGFTQAGFSALTASIFSEEGSTDRIVSMLTPALRALSNFALS